MLRQRRWKNSNKLGYQKMLLKMFLINYMRTSIGHFTNHVKCPMIFCITNDVEFVLVRRGGKRYDDYWK